MMRIERARIEAAPSPLLELVQTRFDDLDMHRHVNNTAVVVLLQEARARFNVHIGLRSLPAGNRAVVAGLQVEYVRELFHPAPVEIATSVSALGRSSISIGQSIRQDGRIAVYAECVMVLSDANGATPLPNSVRAACQPFLQAAR